MKSQQEIDAWSHYWHADRLDSCIAGRGEEDEKGLQTLWRNFLDLVPNKGKVLDLACGNGAVSIRLLKAAHTAGKSINVSAVDLADIDPNNFVNTKGLAGKVTFRGKTDITNLPYGDLAFEAAVSQFGFEYAVSDRACTELLRILKPGGVFQLLLHHKNSALVAPNVAQIEEIDRLLAPHGVAESICTFLEASQASQKKAFAALEESGRVVTEYFSGELPRITQQIFSAVRQLIERRDLKQDVRIAAAKDMKVRLEHERERMRQLGNAALSQQSVQTLTGVLEKAGAFDVSAEEFTIGQDNALLGWLVKGQKA